MKIAIWKTGHPIADTVADALKEGLNGEIFYTESANRARHDSKKHDSKNICASADASIAYGILRGTTNIFRSAANWFNIDRGYFNSGHFDGYYRISLRGTQQAIGLDKLTPDYDRLRALGVDIKPWRGFDQSKPVLVCPPTDAVRAFFCYTGMGFNTPYKDKNYVVRQKGDQSSLNFNDYNYVLTFNSSVGWQALAAGIPCVSDPKHSIVGAWFKDCGTLMDDLSKRQYLEREQLFGVMANLQLTLDEMRSGKIWEVVSRLMSTSDSTPEKPSALTSPPIAS